MCVAQLTLSLALTLTLGCAHQGASQQTNAGGTPQDTTPEESFGNTSLCEMKDGGETPTTQVEIDPLQSECGAGDMTACHALGLAYRDGQYVSQEINQAAAHFAKACDGGLPAGCNDLGLLQLRGVIPTLNDGMRNIQGSCSAGYGPACANLGFMYAKGYGVAPSPKVANGFFEKACDLGDGAACYELALSHLDQGPGGTEDVEAARAYLETGCAAGSPESCIVRGAYGVRVALEQEEPDLADAHGWYTKACGLCSELGPNGEPPFSPAVPISQPKPKFPSEAKERRLERAEIRYILLIGADGRVKHVSGVAAHHTYDNNVVQALSKWTFEPATLRGEAVPWLWGQTFVFSLER